MSQFGCGPGSLASERRRFGFILRGVPAHIRSDNGPELVAKKEREAWLIERKKRASASLLTCAAAPLQTPASTQLRLRHQSAISSEPKTSTIP